MCTEYLYNCLLKKYKFDKIVKHYIIKGTLMKKHYMMFIKITIILIVSTTIYFIHSQHNKVLVLYSYNIDYIWIQQQDAGSISIFKHYPNITVRRHYMDLKNNTSDRFKVSAQTTALELIKNWNPDVIILADDIAQQLIGSKFINDPHISIVFCAVNGEVDKYGYDGAENITGIYERKPLFAIKEAVLMLAKNKDIKNANIVFVCDTSDSVTAELPQFEKFDWKPLIIHPPLRAPNFNTWKRQILKANEFADFILVSDYREFKLPDGNKEPTLPIDIMSWTEVNSKVPIIGMSLINVFDGGVLSVFNSGYEQGIVSAKMAIKILEGVKAKDIPREYTKRFLTDINKSAVGQRDLQISEIFKELSENSDKINGKDYDIKQR